jgi:hypothetical protein
MRLDKQLVLDELRTGRARATRFSKAIAELPRRIDHDQHARASAAEVLGFDPGIARACKGRRERGRCEVSERLQI